MKDRLGQLLDENGVLYGLICRDLTATDLELMAQSGYHFVWIDLEHGPQSTTEALRLGRLATHLGLVPLVRTLELSRTHVQRLLDGGIQIVNLPDVKDPSAAAHLVQLGKYPPLGQRGVSSTSAGTGFTLGDDTRQTLEETNSATHLMVMFESDPAYEQREAILAVDGIDLATVGPQDWSVGKGLFGDEARSYLAPKIEDILVSVAEAGKMATMSVAGTEEARHYYDLGVRIFFLGVDVALKRKTFADTLDSTRDAFSASLDT